MKFPASAKKAALIAAGLQERREIVNVMTFLAGCGVGAGYAARIYRRYGEETIAKVKENPYRLAEDVFGIGFKTADKIALEMGLAADSPYRIRAALVFYLKEAQEQGHVFLPRSELIAKVREALSLPEQTIGEELIDCQLELLAADRRLIVEERPEEAVYSAPLYYAECYVARRLLQLARSSQEIPVLKSFLQAEREGFAGPAQKEAVLMAHKPGCW